ncbi:MAG: Ldh family oxidoreductase, partial [Actinomycetota bacterium]|nr:Ldh family oxidoreductase [Actinomycetota bacterium]
MQTETVLRKLRALGFDDQDAAVLADHFMEAERRGKRGHGLARINWLADERMEARGAGRLVVEEEGYQRWDGDGAIGYLMLA